MNSTEKPVHAVLIFEAIGRPPEYLTQVLNQNVITNIKEEKGVEIISEKVNTPREMENNKGFYTNFAEVEVKAENILYLVILMFKYMPAHVDILSPEDISIKNHEMGDVLNELIRRLHGYDELTRIVQNERAVMEKRLKDLTEQLKMANSKTETKQTKEKKKPAAKKLSKPQKSKSKKK